jgi:excinuclease ABC subunit C
MQREDLNKLKLPDVPGAYMFLGPKREILYVGKATSLRDRVRSYFGSNLINTRGERIVAMVERAKSLQWQETGSVLEALILEANLIKKYQPPYNVDDKDDKSWNYVVITREDFPRILVVRGRELEQKWNPNQIKYTFGPFPQGGVLKEALKIVRKIFPFRDTCIPCLEKMAQSVRRQSVRRRLTDCKPCFNRQLGLCPGVCSGEVSRAEYALTIRHIRQLFSGNMKGLKRTLAAEMKTAAQAEYFEKAATVRQQISALEHIRDVSLIKTEELTLPASSRRAGFRIEAYDTAHTAGTETVAVMTVIQDGEPDKNSYRKFTIHTATNDDVATLKEVLLRRLRHLEWPLPRVFVVDGGLAQLRAAHTILKHAGILIPVVGVVKDSAHKPQRLIGDAMMIKTHEREILLANAEAHRFSITWHRTRLRKRIVT